MNKLKYIVLFSLLSIVACEERFDPIPTDQPHDIVVEGHIEAGDVPFPTYVLLTKTFPFNSAILPSDITNLFIHDAYVTVSDGQNTVELVELCTSDLPDEFRDIIFETIPDIDENVDICVYVDISFSMFGQVGKTYDLYIDVEDKEITSSTTITPSVPLDSFYFIQAPGDEFPHLREMRVRLSDPLNQENQYRYFTSTNGGQFVAGFNSVLNDKLFDGQTFDFPLPKGEYKNRESESDLFGMYEPGDSVIVKWTTIDEPHHDFWNSLEFNMVNQGPFGSYTQVNTNIEGGLGIWGGYTAGYTLLVVPE